MVVVLLTIPLELFQNVMPIIFAKKKVMAQVPMKVCRHLYKALFSFFSLHALTCLGPFQISCTVLNKSLFDASDFLSLLGLSSSGLLLRACFILFDSGVALGEALFLLLLFFSAGEMA